MLPDKDEFNKNEERWAESSADADLD